MHSEQAACAASFQLICARAYSAGGTDHGENQDGI